MPRHASIHAAGVIIATKPLFHYSAVDSHNVTLNTAAELEAMGLLKIDILALSNLSMMQKIIDSIAEVKPNFSLKSIPLDDQKTFDLISRGDTMTIFQLESKGVQDILKAIKPSNIEELANCISLYRPGPIK